MKNLTAALVALAVAAKPGKLDRRAMRVKRDAEKNLSAAVTAIAAATWEGLDISRRAQNLSPGLIVIEQRFAGLAQRLRESWAVIDGTRTTTMPTRQARSQRSTRSLR